MELLKVKNLHKSYSAKKVLNEISFSLQPNSITALVGVNGAGKSSLLKIIANLLSYQKGEVFLKGRNLDLEPLYFQQKLRFLSEVNPIYEDLSVWEYLFYINSLYPNLPQKNNLTRVEENLENFFHPLMNRLGIYERKNSLIKNLSKGLKQRVGILASLIGEPELILFDEPFSGLDPEQILEMRIFFSFLKSKLAILFSTHLLNEVDYLADQVIFINQGKIVGEEKINSNPEKEFYASTKINGKKSNLNLSSLPAIFPTGFYRLTLKKNPLIDKQAGSEVLDEKYLGVRNVLKDNYLYLENNKIAFLELFQKIEKRGYKVVEINLFKKKLEDKFLQYLRKAK